MQKKGREILGDLPSLQHMSGRIRNRAFGLQPFFQIITFPVVLPQ